MKHRFARLLALVLSLALILGLFSGLSVWAEDGRATGPAEKSSASVSDAEDEPVPTDGDIYDLSIAGTQVTGENCGDVLGDGVFSYDPESKTLLIRGDCSCETTVIYSEIEGLIIRASGDCRLETTGDVCIHLRAGTSIRSADGPDSALDVIGSDTGICLDRMDSLDAATLDIRRVSVSASGGSFGICGRLSKDKLQLYKADLCAAGAQGAVCGFEDGITMELCSVTDPADCAVGATAITDASGSNLTNVTIRARRWRIALDCQGGETDADWLETNYQNKIWDLPLPTKAGCSFAGWYTAASGGTLVTTEYAYTSDETIYAAWVPSAGKLAYGWYFNEDPEAEGWTFTDLDGDGLGWEWGLARDNLKIPEGCGALTSKSWDSELGGLTPDNYAMSPAIKLPYGTATLSLWAGPEDRLYSNEHFSVYVCTSGTLEDLNCVSGETPLTVMDGARRFDIDLSDFAGWTVHLVIRHHDTKDRYALLVDMVEIYGYFDSYDLWVGGVQVTEMNKNDILRNGRFRYDPDEETLFISGDCQSNRSVIRSGIDGLTIVAERDATLTSRRGAAIESAGSLTITGNRTLNLSGEQEAGILLASEEELTLTVDGSQGLRLNVTGAAVGIAGAEKQEAVILDHAKLRVTGGNGAFSQIGRGITAAGCSLIKPKDGYVGEHDVRNADGSIAAEAIFGAPVNAITAPAVLEAALNRTVLIDCAVEPADADDPGVIFTSSDPNVASVAEDGMVTPHAPGKTTVTITSNSDPDVKAACEVTVVNKGLSPITFYGFFLRHSSDSLDNTWVSFRSTDVTSVTPLAALSADTYAAAYAYGTVYGFTAGSKFYTAPLDDLSDMTYLDQDHPYGSIGTMTYDYVRQVLFAFTRHDEKNLLLLIDPATGAILRENLIAGLHEPAMGLAADKAGKGWVVDAAGDLYTLDFDTLAVSKVGSTGLPARYFQDLCCDFDSGELYWAHCSEAAINYLYAVDKQTARATPVGLVSSEANSLVGLFSLPSTEPANVAGGKPAGLVVSPCKAALCVDETLQLRAMALPLNARPVTAKWSSSDLSVASVDANGLVIARKGGVAVITASAENGALIASMELTVTEVDSPLQFGWYFETGEDGDDWKDWCFLDGDGNGRNWTRNNDSGAYQGSGYLYSSSMSHTPDNWAFTPTFPVPEGAFLSYWIRGSLTWPDTYSIYIGGSQEISDMTVFPGADHLAAGEGEYVNHQIDLSAYAGQTVCLAFRHHDCYDRFNLRLDNVEIYAARPYYTVTLHSDHGTVPGPLKIAWGYTLPVFSLEPADGLAFYGWYTDAALTAYFDPATPIEGNLDLYAKWGEAVTVTFVSEHGLAPEPLVLAKGSIAAKPKDPTDPVWIFGGWFTDKACTKAYDFSIPVNANLTLYAKWTLARPNPFSDVKEGKYYYTPVLWAYYHDPQITSGTSETKFSPNDTCTRAQIVTFLWRAAGSPEPTTTSNPFTDVKDSKYYYKAVLWTAETGVTSGTAADKFSPNDGCTRAQVVTFLWRFAGIPEPTTTSNPFTDVPAGKYYTKAVLWAAEKGVTAGTSETTFSPNQTCTRGQIVTFLWRYMEG